MIRTLRNVKPIAGVLLFFVTWQFLSLSTLVAFAAQGPPQAQQAAPPSGAAGAFSEKLQELEGLLEEIGAGLEALEDVSADVAVALVLADELAALDAAVEEEFAAVEAMLDGIGASGKITSRLTHARNEYRKNLKDLKELLTDLRRNKGLPVLLADDVAALLSLIKSKNQKKHQPLDPENLPVRAVKPKPISPKSTKEEFEEDEKYKKPKKHTRNETEEKMSRFASILDLLPDLVSEAHAALPAPVTEDLAETPDVTFTAAIQAKAAELNNQPLAIYRWVRDNVTFVPTFGSIQGADYTLQTGQGNAFDTASLLIALLRTSGVPSRYVLGTIEVPAADVMSWVGGVATPEVAIELLNGGGTPAEGIVSGSAVTAVRLEHVWVEAFVDYIPSRGAVHHAGDSWIPIDPSWKAVNHSEGIDLSAAVPFDAQGFADAITSSALIDGATGSATGVDCETVSQTRSDYGAQLSDHLAVNYPGATVGDLIGESTVTPWELPIFPSAHPYQVTITGLRAAEIPEGLRHGLRIGLGDVAAPVIDATFSLPEIAGKNLTLGYVPATQDDAAVIAAYLPDTSGTLADLPSELPAYLIEVIPELRLDGTVIASGTPIGLGESQDLDLTFTAPNGTSDIVSSVLTTGEYGALVLDTGKISQSSLADLQDGLSTALDRLTAGDFASLSREELLGTVLTAAGAAYFAGLDRMNTIKASTFEVLDRRLPSALYVRSLVSTASALGVPLSVSADGLGIDTVRRLDLVQSKGEGSEEAFLYGAGLDASALAHLTGEHLFGPDDASLDGISAIQAMAVANGAGVPIYTINGDNIAALLPLLQLNAEVISDIENAVNAGLVAVAPESDIAIGTWSGTGYLVIDPATGESAALLSEGLNGALLKGLPWLEKVLAMNLEAGAEPILQPLYDSVVSEQLLASYNASVTGISKVEELMAGSFLDLLVSGVLSEGLTASLDCHLDPGNQSTDPGACLALSLGAVCLAKDLVPIATFNTAPVADAGVDQAVEGGTYVILDGSGSDDPDGDTLKYHWSFDAIPQGSSAILSSSAAVMPGFVVNLPGTYTVRLVVDDGEAYSEADTVTITVSPALVAVPNVEGMVLVEAESAIAAAGLSLGAVDYAYHETVPAYHVLSQDPAAAVQAARGSNLVLTLSLGPDTGGEAPYMEVSFDREPAVYSAGEQALLTISAEDDSGSVTVTMLLDGASAPVTLPTTTIDTTGMISGSRHTVEVSAADSFGNTTTIIEHFGIGDPTDTTAPVAMVTTPGVGDEITSPTDIIGTASDDNLLGYQIMYTPVDQPGGTVLAEGDLSVIDGTLGRLDPTLMLNGIYDVFLIVTDTSGNVTEAYTQVHVTGQMKVGNFTVSFTDLEIPVAGMPVTVTRTYDSRDKTVGDFGYGWQVDFQTVKTEENGTPGDGWGQESDGDPYLPTWCITGDRYVSVSLPDGRTEEFDVVPSPDCQQFYPINEVSVSFEARPGTTSTITATNPGTFLFVNGQMFDFETAEVYDPNAYTLTTIDGMVFKLDQGYGITQIVDPNGNTIDYSDSGIIHSAGKSVSFTRDAEGRIAKVTDPAGNEILYGYDERGDLVSVTDREGNVTRFGYNRTHGLTDIEDPRGITPVRNEYDDAGRLVAHIDAAGNRIEYTHDIEGRQEIVKDRLGHQSLYVYDEEGRVLAKADPLGHTTSYTYDAHGNVLTETDPLGNVTESTYDEDNNKLTETRYLDSVPVATSYTYNAQGQMLATIDPMGHVTTNTYDTKGNLRTTTDPLNNTTTNTYDDQGNLLTTRDSLNNTTSYVYDAAGNLRIQTDPEYNVTTYTYDSNGNQLTETGPRGGVTTYTYDADGRQLSVEDPLGNVTRTEYDSAGNRLAEVDFLGVSPSYVYNSAGKLVGTTYPDGTSTSTTYDLEGNRISSTDQAARTTTYTYDANKQLTLVIYADGTTQSYGYDDAGRQTTVTDASGNTSTKVYDDLGRVEQDFDPDGHTTTFAYDLNGNQTSITDANSHTTSFVYDDNGRLTTTTLPGGQTSSVAYDAEGRKTSETDAAGIATSFGYDANGNLTSVTDAMDGITKYEYDEAGNRTAIVDARGNRTEFVLDLANRLNEKRMPNGGVETYVYDDAGRQESKTKADGNAISYAYDALGRLISRGYPDNSSVEFSYTATGRRDTVTDMRGVTSYQYDNRDRLGLHTYPDGQTIGYGYDPEGRIESLTSLSGTVSYAYENSGRLKEVHDPAGNITSYGYDPAGNRTGLAYPNGTSVAYVYDDNNRLTNLTHTNSVAEVLASYAYTLGPTGNRTQINEDTGIIRAYQYDDLYRLTQDQVTGPAGAQTYQDDYVYDAVGNRLAKTHADAGAQTSTIDYNYNNADQLLTENGNIYEYDLNGNLVSKTDASGTTTYTWDYENRLVGVESPSGTVAYEYDADGNRVSSTTSAGTTKYLVDTNRALAQVFAEYTPEDIHLASYVYADDLISMTRGSKTHWYHFDGLGSTRMLTDATGAVTDTYDFEAFGELIAQTGSTENNFLFTGQQQDPNVGFYYLRARYYGPVNGRFFSIDPFAGNINDPKSLHKYMYAHNNPVVNIDPSGNYTLVEMATVAGIVTSLAGLALPIFNRMLKKFSGRTNNFILKFIAGGSGGFGPYIGALTAVMWEMPPDGYYRHADYDFFENQKRAMYFIRMFGVGVGITGGATAGGSFFEEEIPVKTDTPRQLEDFEGFGYIGGASVGVGVGIDILKNIWLPDGTLLPIQSGYTFAGGASVYHVATYWRITDYF